MSLLTSVNSGSAAQPYAVSNLGTTSFPVAGALGGVLKIEDNGLGQSAVRSSDAAGSLVLGANDAAPAYITLSAGTTSIGTDVNMTNGGSALRLQNGADLLVTGDAVFQGNMTPGALLSFSAPSANYLAGGSGTALAQPSFADGTYAITLVPATLADAPFALSTIARWQGGVWSGGSVRTTAIGGVQNAIINPAGATLTYYNEKAGGVDAGVVYTRLSA